MNLIYLASQSPRRLKILQEANFNVQVIDIAVDEIYPDDLNVYEVATFLAKLKMETTLNQRTDLADKTIITADTVVIYNNSILGKPKNIDEAKQTLQLLNNQVHEVMTGVCIYHQRKINLLSDITKVFFKNITLDEIEHYIQNYKVLDKAGSYNIEEYIGVEKIEGSYTNVVGLPIELITNLL